MARILPFDRPVSSTPDASSPEAYNDRLVSETTIFCKRLLKYYQSTGLWHEKCHAPMNDALQSLQEVCGIMAEYAHAKK